MLLAEKVSKYKEKADLSDDKRLFYLERVRGVEPAYCV